MKMLKLKRIIFKKQIEREEIKKKIEDAYRKKLITSTGYIILMDKVWNGNQYLASLLLIKALKGLEA